MGRHTGGQRGALHRAPSPEEDGPWGAMRGIGDACPFHTSTACSLPERGARADESFPYMTQSCSPPIFGFPSFPPIIPARTFPLASRAAVSNEQHAQRQTHHGPSHSRITRRPWKTSSLEDQHFLFCGLSPFAHARPSPFGVHPFWGAEGSCLGTRPDHEASIRYLQH